MRPYDIAAVRRCDHPRHTPGSQREPDFGTNTTLISQPRTAGALVAALPIGRRRLPASWSEYLVLLPVLPIGVLILAGEAYNSTALMYVGAGAAFIAAILSPAVGFATLMLMAPLKPPPVIPAPGFNALLVGAILVGCVYRLPIDRPSLRPSAPLVLLLAFMLYVTAQQLPEMAAGWAGDVAHLIGFYFFQLLTGLGAIVAGAYVLRQHRAGPFIAAGVAAAIIAALLALATFDSPSVRGPLAGLLSRPDGMTRAVGPFGNPNYFGQFQATAIVAVTACAMLATSIRVRLLLMVSLVPLGTALVVSLSRGAAVTALAGLLVLAFAKSRRLGIAAVIAGAAGVLFVYPLFLSWRFGFTNAGTAQMASILAASDGARGEAVIAGLELVASSPIIGVGFGQYQFATAQIAGILYGQSAHNWYMKVLAEGGIVGITLWLSLLVAVCVGLWRRGRPERVLGFALLATLVVGSMFAEPPSSFQMSAFEAMVIVAALAGAWRPANGKPIDDPATGARAPSQPARRGASWAREPT